jgi:hypothetical protein
MKKVLYILTLLLAFATITSAQAPWRAKLYFHFTDSNNSRYTDTLWFGFDQAGDISYQPELDELDTAIRYNRAYINNPLVKSQLNSKCGNMRKDIREFKPRETYFDIFTYGKLDSITYDTIDYIYIYDSTQRISKAFIETYTFDIRGAHRNTHTISRDVWQLLNNQISYYGFLVNSENVLSNFIQHSFIDTDCRNIPFDLTQVNQLALVLYYGWWVGANEHDKTSLDVKIYPNPSTGLCQLTNLPADQKISLSIKAIDGRVLSQYDLQQNESVIDLSNYEAGVYYVTLTIGDKNTNNSNKTIKIYKL